MKNTSTNTSLAKRVGRTAGTGLIKLGQFIMMKNFKRALSSFFTAAFAVIYMALNTTTAFAAMIDERPKTDDEVTAEALYVHTDNPEADAVFNAYVDVAVKMIGTDYYADSYIFPTMFVACCGGKQEQVHQLRTVSKMEQLLWEVTYTELCYLLKHKKRIGYMGYAGSMG